MSQRFDKQQMIETFRANHRDPRNLAMHVAGFWLIFRALKRLFSGRIFRAAISGGAGFALLAGGHQLEGTPMFSMFKQPQQQEHVGNGQLART